MLSCRCMVAVLEAEACVAYGLSINENVSFLIVSEAVFWLGAHWATRRLKFADSPGLLLFASFWVGLAIRDEATAIRRINHFSSLSL